MSRLIVTEGAVSGLERCRLFLAKRNPKASRKASEVIGYYFSLLESEPEMGRPIEELPELRELIIPFGESGYSALYRFESEGGTVFILAFWHQKEAGY